MGRRSGRTELVGCDLRASYECYSGRCDITSERTDVVLARGRSSPSRSSAGAGQSTRVRGEGVQRHEHPDGYELLSVSSPVGNDTRIKLRLVGAPERDPGYVLLELRAGHVLGLGECEPRLMIDGEVKELPDVVHNSRWGSDLFRMKFPRRSLFALAGGQHVVFRLCDERIDLDERPHQLVRSFAAVWQEELAWEQDAEGAGGLAAPAAGWPSWRLAGVKQPAARRSKLSTETLFERLHPSVYTVVVDVPGGNSQGSAVAVSTSELLTNCHVLQEATAITVHSSDLELNARLTKSDPATDRCIVELVDGEVKPIEAVREFGDVRIGEAVYTLGAPVGLEHTIAQGIVSGKRETEDAAYIQTTAPISSGSSGGGLFDAHGNLVGITTLTIEGRGSATTQSLNFAIAADSFWDAEQAETEEVKDEAGEADDESPAKDTPPAPAPGLPAAQVTSESE